MKKIFSGCLTVIILFFVLIIVIGSCSNGSDDKEDTKNTSTESTQKNNVKEEKKTVSKDTSVEKKKESKKEKTYKIGDVVKISKIAVKAKSTTTATTISSETAKGIYYIVEVTTANKGTKAITVSDNAFKLINGDKEYEGDSYATSIYNNDKGMNTSYFLEQINPDMKISGYIVFDIPKDVAKKELKLRVKPNMFLSDKADIVLK